MLVTGVMLFIQLSAVFQTSEDVGEHDSQQKQADGGSYGELTVKLRLKLKKVWKTTRPFRYNLNQIPRDYTVEMTNRFKGLDLVDRVPEDLCIKLHNIV